MNWSKARQAIEKIAKNGAGLQLRSILVFLLGPVVKYLVQEGEIPALAGYLGDALMIAGFIGLVVSMTAMILRRERAVAPAPPA